MNKNKESPKQIKFIIFIILFSSFKKDNKNIININIIIINKTIFISFFLIFDLMLLKILLFLLLVISLVSSLFKLAIVFYQMKKKIKYIMNIKKNLRNFI